MAAWNPGSRGGANTGTTPRLRHSRVTRPTTSGCWCAPWKIVSLSNCAWAGSPTCRQCSTNAATATLAVTVVIGQEFTSPPCNAVTLRTSTWGAVLDDQALDDVEAVQFGLAGGHGGQVPARRWCGATDTVAAVQRPAALEDTAEGAYRGERVGASGLQRGVDRLGAELAQIAGVLQLATQGQHKVLQVRRGPIDWPAPSGRAPRDVGAVEPLAVGPCDPELNGGQCHAEASSDLAHGNAPADGGDHLTTTLLDPVFGSLRPPVGRVLSSY